MELAEDEFLVARTFVVLVLAARQMAALVVSPAPRLLPHPSWVVAVNEDVTAPLVASDVVALVAIGNVPRSTPLIFAALNSISVAA